MGLLYRPDCSWANKDGFIEKADYYQWLSMNKEDKRMFVGNQPVTIRFNTDEMPPTRHMVNGKYYTSKKKFRDETKARGCIEVGNETSTLLKRRTPKVPDKRQRREDIKKSIYELKNGRDINKELREIKYD